MGKYFPIYSYIGKPFLIYDFATAPLWISLYMGKKFIFFFISVETKIFAFDFWENHFRAFHKNFLRKYKENYKKTFDTLYIILMTWDFSWKWKKHFRFNRSPDSHGSAICFRLILDPESIFGNIDRGVQIFSSKRKGNLEVLQQLKMFFLVASFVLEKRPKEKGSANYGCGSATHCVNLLYTKNCLSANLSSGFLPAKYRQFQTKLCCFWKATEVTEQHSYCEVYILRTFFKLDMVTLTRKKILLYCLVPIYLSD